MFRYKHELNYKVLGGLRHWALGLGGELREVTELIWGPPNEASPPHDGSNPTRWPQMAVMLQHKSILKTFKTKQSSIGEKKKMHQFLRVLMVGHHLNKSILTRRNAGPSIIISLLTKKSLTRPSLHSQVGIDRTIKTSPPLPLPCLKQHIHKLGAGGNQLFNK